MYKFQGTLESEWYLVVIIKFLESITKIINNRGKHIIFNIYKKQPQYLSWD